MSEILTKEQAESMRPKKMGYYVHSFDMETMIASHEALRASLAEAERECERLRTGLFDQLREAADAGIIYGGFNGSSMGQERMRHYAAIIAERMIRRTSGE